MNNFKNLIVWQKGLEIAREAFKLTISFPKEEKFGLSSQITRAAVSIPSNVAEGCSRQSTKEFKRFLEISLGSAFELETQLLIAEAANFGESNKRKGLQFLVIEEQKMLSAFITKLSL